MNAKKAKETLLIHSDFYTENEKSFLYLIKDKNCCSQKLFIEIMEIMEILSDKYYFAENDGEIIKATYSIIFWCRSWLGSGMIEKNMGKKIQEELLCYVQIIEETFYYLVAGDKEEAFWSYNEYLDGRYSL